MVGVVVHADVLAIVFKPRAERLEENLAVAGLDYVPYFVVVGFVALYLPPKRSVAEVAEFIPLQIAEFLVAANIKPAAVAEERPGDDVAGQSRQVPVVAVK